MGNELERSCIFRGASPNLRSHGTLILKFGSAVFEKTKKFKNWVKHSRTNFPKAVDSRQNEKETTGLCRHMEEIVFFAKK